MDHNERLCLGSAHGSNERNHEFLGRLRNIDEDTLPLFQLRGVPGKDTSQGVIARIGHGGGIEAVG
jgi:hypothetical protein